MASSSAAMTNPLTQAVTEKLGKGNFLMWKAQVVPVIRGALLEGFINGTSKAPEMELIVGTGDAAKKIPNDEYARWAAQDQ